MTKPLISTAGIPPTIHASVMSSGGGTKDIEIAAEYALALYVDKRELVSLMTLGQMPEALVIGWLLSQRLINTVDDIEEVRVDWEVGVAAVYTHHGIATQLDERRTITSGCGQGTMFSRLMEDVEMLTFNRPVLFAPPALFELLHTIREQESVYKRAGAVHCCALAEQDGSSASILCSVEDIGRHNAADAIAGWMQLNDISGDGKVFYTTGRLTSEMIIKCAQMGIPYLVSRSGTTAMGYQLARKVGLTLIGRAIHQRYLIFTGAEYFAG